MISMKTITENECKHPPTRIYFWFAYNYKTGKNDIPCAGCCDCGKILLGGITEVEMSIADESNILLGVQSNE
jgi:hypothetical protein